MLYYSNRIIYTLSMILIVIAVFTTIEHNNVTRRITLFLEVVFILYCIINVNYQKVNFLALCICFLCFFYIFVLTSSFLLLREQYSGSTYFFVQSIKVLIYLIILPGSLGRKLISRHSLVKVFKVLLILFSIKYTFLFFFLGIDRPILIFENNFELQSLLMIYAVVAFNKAPNLMIKLLLFYIVLISGSRSALVCMIFVEFFVSMKKLDYKIFFVFLVTTVLVLLSYQVFMERMGDRTLESIDRVKFLFAFLYETGNSFSPLNYLFGNDTFLPLSQSTCNSLSFYTTFFSKDLSYCYSAIYHSYNLRVLYDFGIIGGILIYFLFYTYLSIAKVPARLKFIMFGIALLNGMSVSALNSYYYIMPLFFVLNLYCFYDRKEPQAL